MVSLAVVRPQFDNASSLREFAAWPATSLERLSALCRFLPVTGDVLGAQGKPYKVTVKRRTVFLCCPDCKEAITKNPDKYLAKLKADQ